MRDRSGIAKTFRGGGAIVTEHGNTPDRLVKSIDRKVREGRCFRLKENLELKKDKAGCTGTVQVGVVIRMSTKRLTGLGWMYVFEGWFEQDGEWKSVGQFDVVNRYVISEELARIGELIEDEKLDTLEPPDTQPWANTIEEIDSGR